MLWGKKDAVNFCLSTGAGGLSEAVKVCGGEVFINIEESVHV